MRPPAALVFSLTLAALLPAPLEAARPFYDRTHPSEVFGGERNYRIFLPPGYESGNANYPVIYYFHGNGDRYTLELYDGGTDTVPKIVDYVSRYDVIVVSVDGYVPEDYGGFYWGYPWDVQPDGGQYDFGAYFQELVQHIDSKYRTWTDRRHRATSGLSMGGFMSLWLSGRYPHLIGSASAFNPGPDFYTGDAGRRVLWRPMDHVSNHGLSMIRLIHASADFMGQYHEETRDVYARAAGVAFEYRLDQFYRHWTTSVAETFDFHRRAFERSNLNNVPELFDHANPYRAFEVWGYAVDSEGGEPGITYLSQVRQAGYRVTTRRWAPDGPPLPQRRIKIRTPPLYPAGREYTVADLHLTSGEVSHRQVTADERGRLTVEIDGSGHQISFFGPGTGSHPPVLLPPGKTSQLRLPPGESVPVPLRVYNPRETSMTDVRLRVSSEYPTVELPGSVEVRLPALEPGQVLQLDDRVKARITASRGYYAHARIDVQFTFDDWHEWSEAVDLQILPEAIPSPAELRLVDGGPVTLPVFRQRGIHGGGDSQERIVTEGSGDGDGVLEPGEEATFWVRVEQGLDPLDKNNWYRCKVEPDGRWLAEVAQIEEPKGGETTGAVSRTSVMRMAKDTPPDTLIPVLLDCECWGFLYDPAFRHAGRKQREALQLHRRNLFRAEIEVR